jgi:hypothetical protein
MDEVSTLVLHKFAHFLLNFMFMVIRVPSALLSTLLLGKLAFLDPIFIWKVDLGDFYQLNADLVVSSLQYQELHAHHLSPVGLVVSWRFLWAAPNLEQQVKTGWPLPAGLVVAWCCPLAGPVVLVVCKGWVLEPWKSLS